VLSLLVFSTRGGEGRGGKGRGGEERRAEQSRAEQSREEILCKEDNELHMTNMTKM